MYYYYYYYYYYFVGTALFYKENIWQTPTIMTLSYILIHY